MKLLLLFILFISFNLHSQPWKQLANIPTDGRDDGVSFSINGLGYVVTGNMPAGGSNELWCFDSNKNAWTEKNTFPGQERQYAGAFVLNNKAYVMCGYSATGLPLKDVWEYDPQHDSWKQMNDFTGAPRWTFFQFTADNFGFIGAGAVPDSSVADCWKYDSEKDHWTQIADYPEGRMREVLGFSIGDHCFAGTGLNVNPLTFSKKFYTYDYKSDTWKSISDFPGTARAYVGGAGTGTKAVVGGGWGESSDFKTDFYYLSIDGTWEEAASAPIQGWRGMSTFSSFDEVFFLCGLYADISRTSNVFSLKPDQDFFPHLYPNPTEERSYLYYLPNQSVEVFDLKGNLVFTSTTDFEGYCRLTEVVSGEYIIRVGNVDDETKSLRWVVK